MSCACIACDRSSGFFADRRRDEVQVLALEAPADAAAVLVVNEAGLRKRAILRWFFAQAQKSPALSPRHFALRNLQGRPEEFRE